MAVYGLYSAGGFAREVRASLVESLRISGVNDYEVVFIDDDEDIVGQMIHGSKVLNYADFTKLPDKRISVCFAEPKLKQEKAVMAANDGIAFFPIVAPTSIKGDNVAVGEGAIFANNTIITSDAVIGAHFHCNIFAYVAHDCVIGDYVTFAPRVSLNGRVVVEDRVYVGSDATILPGKITEPLVIGADAVIGAGAVVTKSVAPGTTVVGNPAKPLAR